jgi:hypothetical protein
MPEIIKSLRIVSSTKKQMVIWRRLSGRGNWILKSIHRRWSMKKILNLGDHLKASVIWCNLCYIVLMNEFCPSNEPINQSIKRINQWGISKCLLLPERRLPSWRWKLEDNLEFSQKYLSFESKAESAIPLRNSIAQINWLKYFVIGNQFDPKHQFTRNPLQAIDKDGIFPGQLWETIIRKLDQCLELHRQPPLYLINEEE